ncbi:MAG: hypothetical protein EXS06_01920 [Planctomycetaceae bacterium]|nr:hypothetical protein [Planctomycetaceae bacterium]
MHFFQSCPICGRSLRIRVTLLGKKVFCRHCGGGFPARGGAAGAGAAIHDASRSEPAAEPSLEERVDLLLARASLVLARSGVGGSGGCDGAFGSD